MKFIAVTLALLPCLVLGSQSKANDTGPDVARQAVAEGSNIFSRELYKILSSSPGNLVMSPISVHSVLATAWFGATGNTALQLASGLHLPENISLVQPGFRSLLTSVQSVQGITLDMANKLYIQQGYQVKAPFRQAAINDFRSDAEEVNFVNETEASRLRINQWVEQKTHGKIKDLIASGSLSDSTRILAVNAIYFKGGWFKPFDANYTAEEPFYTSSNTTITVPMMHQTDYFQHGSFPELGFRAVKLLYRGPSDQYVNQDISKSMMILVPNEVDGLAALESKLPSLNLMNISELLWKEELILSLPRFKVESTLKLVDSLQQLGITDVFNPGAELGGITEDNVYVRDVVQKAFIEVGEKGTEAAASTYYELVNFSGSSPVELKIDHPFLFVILDEVTDAILFMGRVTEPNS